MRVTLLALATVAVMQSLAPSGAVADGCYISEVAHPKPPAIPRQRALIVHRDGVERLIVESSLDAEGQSFGWIIPVPAPPSNLAKVTPGVLDTLSSVTEPEITHDLKREFRATVILAAMATLIFAGLFNTKRVQILVAILCILLLVSLVPILATTRGISSSNIEGVNVRERAQVGSYDVAVLEAPTADALDRWLKENGYVNLPGSGRMIVEDYIRGKWSFVVARLRKEEAGLCSPHPIFLTFPAKTAVYPMRLTSLSASPVALELYCLADYQASVDGLRLDFCDILQGPESRVVSVNYASDPRMELYRCRSCRETVGLPTLVSMLWNGCVLTRLSAELKPEGMARDYGIDHHEPSAFRHHWYSHKGAWMTGAIISLLGWGLLLIFGGTVVRNHCEINKALSIAFRRVFLPGTAFALLLVGVVFLVLPRTPVVVEKRGGLSRIFAVHELAEQMSGFAKSEHGFAGLPVEAVRDCCRAYLRDEARQANNLAGALIREQEAPGDYQIIEDERGVVFRGFKADGFPFEEVLRPAISDSKPAS